MCRPTASWSVFVSGMEKTASPSGNVVVCFSVTLTRSHSAIELHEEAIVCEAVVPGGAGLLEAAQEFVRPWVVVLLVGFAAAVQRLVYEGHIRRVGWALVR